MCPKIHLIVAVSENMGIGNRGKLPWHLKQELKYFSKMTRRISDATKCNAVIMGRRTWESIPASNRPLAKRHNVVLSSQSMLLPDGVLLCHSLESALFNLNNNGVETAWIIGGSSVYKEALEKGLCEKLYITRIFRSYECDVFLPEFGPEFCLTSDPDVPEEVQEENGVSYKFEVYEKSKSNI